MYKLTYFILIPVVLVLSACGGGSSDSGGGSAPPGDLAGTYTGPATVTVTANGQSETVTDTITVVVDSKGNARIAGTNINTAFDGDSFAAVVPVSASGLSCSGSVTINGTVRGITITGTISGNSVTCEGVPIELSGRFKLTKTSQSKAALEFLGETGNAIREMVH